MAAEPESESTPRHDYLSAARPNMLDILSSGGVVRGRGKTILQQKQGHHTCVQPPTRDSTPFYMELLI